MTYLIISVLVTVVFTGLFFVLDKGFSKQDIVYATLLGFSWPILLTALIACGIVVLVNYLKEKIRSIYVRFN